MRLVSRSLILPVGGSLTACAHGRLLFSGEASLSSNCALLGGTGAAQSSAATLLRNSATQLSNNAALLDNNIPSPSGAALLSLSNGAMPARIATARIDNNPLQDNMAAKSSCIIPMQVCAMPMQSNATLPHEGTPSSPSLKGGTDRTNAKNAARTELEDALSQLGTYVNLTAKGDQAIVDLSGFPSYTTDHVRSQGGVTFIPQNVRWEDGTVSSQEILRWKGDGSRSMYEVQTCTGDPGVEANWTYRGSFSGGRAVINGFTPGTIVWGRVRKIGTGGQVGDWSDPAQIRAS